MAATARLRPPSLPGLRARFSGRLGLAALAASLVVADLLVAAAIAVPRAAVLLPLLLAIGGLVALFRIPVLMFAAVAVMSASVLHVDFLPTVGPAKLYEAVLAGLLLVAAVRPRRRTWGGASGVALMVFLALLALAQVAAFLGGRVSLAGAVNWPRSLLLVAVFFVIVRLLPDAASLRKVVLAAALVAAGSAIIAAQASLGFGVGDYFQDPGFVYVVDDEGVGGLARVRYPGLALAYGFFWVVVVLVLHSRGLRRAGWLLVLGLMVLALAVSFNRNMWLGLIGGVLLILVFGGTGVRSKLLTRFAVAATTAIVVVLLAGGGLVAGGDSPLKPLADRAGTLLHDPATIGSQQKSLQGRAQETKQALRTIGGNLLTGVGAGVHYGQYFNEERSGGRFVRTQQVFLHNQWLWLALVGGIPLLLAWAAFLGTTLRRAFGPRRDPFVAACGIGLAMIMVSALVELYFSTTGMTFAIGLLAGLVHAGLDVDEPAAAE